MRNKGVVNIAILMFGLCGYGAVAMAQDQNVVKDVFGLTYMGGDYGPGLSKYGAIPNSISWYLKNVTKKRHLNIFEETVVVGHQLYPKNSNLEKDLVALTIFGEAAILLHETMYGEELGIRYSPEHAAINDIGTIVPSRKSNNGIKQFFCKALNSETYPNMLEYTFCQLKLHKDHPLVVELQRNLAAEWMNSFERPLVIDVKMTGEPFEDGSWFVVLSSNNSHWKIELQEDHASCGLPLFRLEKTTFPAFNASSEAITER